MARNHNKDAHAVNNPLVGNTVEFRFTQNQKVAIRVNGLDVGSYAMPDEFDMVDAGSLFTTLFNLAGFNLQDFNNYRKVR